MNENIEWVVSLILEDGTVVRGIQKAIFGHPAIEFYAKNNGIKYTSASAEKKVHFDHFLAQGLRKPLA